MASSTLVAAPVGFGDRVGRRRISTNSPGARPRSASRAATRAPGAVPASVRLTRRGRLAAFLMSLVCLGAVVVAAGQIADASAEASVREHTTVVVQSGETLWGIAREIAPGQDPRAVVSQIRRLNELGTRAIVPGQSLVVPTLG